MPDAIAAAFSAPPARTSSSVALVVAQVAVGLAHRLEVGDDLLGHGLLQVPVAGALEALLDFLGSTPLTAAEISIRLLTPALSGARTISRPESVTALPNFLRIAAGSSST